MNKVVSLACGIIFGMQNTVSYDTEHCFIAGGLQNSIDEECDYSTILNGTLNTVGEGVSLSHISNGMYNKIDHDLGYESIIGGSDNHISLTWDEKGYGYGYNVIGSGTANKVGGIYPDGGTSTYGPKTSFGKATNSGIFSGSWNKLEGVGCAILGGNSNKITKTISQKVLESGKEPIQY